MQRNRKVWPIQRKKRSQKKLSLRKLSDKLFKSAIINIFKELKETTPKESKGSMGMMSHQTEAINKHIEKLHLY